MLAERVTVAAADQGPRCSASLSHPKIEQGRDLIDERVHAPAAAIPLEQRELGVVQPTAFVPARHPAELPDVAAACGEQALDKSVIVQIET